MNIQLLHQSANIIIHLREALREQNAIPMELASGIIKVANEIEQLQKADQLPKYVDYSKDLSVQKRIKQPKQQEVTGPQSQRCKEILGRDCLSERILPLLNIQELITIRLVSTHFKDTVDCYLKHRIPIEEKQLARSLFQFNRIKDFKIYLFEQLPRTQWMLWDQLEIKQFIKDHQKDVELLKKLRTLPQQYDELFKPIVILYAGKDKGPYYEQFKKLNMKHRLKEQDVIKSIVAMDAINIKQAQKFSIECYNMVKWCQASLSLYLLENIFITRFHNDDTDDEQFRELAEYFRVSSGMINIAKRIMKQDSKFVIFLDFRQFQDISVEKQCSTGLQELLTYLLQYLDQSTLLGLRLVNKVTANEVHSALRQNAINSIANYELFKLRNQNIFADKGEILRLGYFNPLFIMCYRMLLENQRELVVYNHYEQMKSVDNKLNHYLQTAFGVLHGNCNLRQLIVQTNLLKVVMKYTNPFNKGISQVLMAKQAMFEIHNLVKNNSKIHYSFQNIYSLYLYLHLFVMLTLSVDPRQYQTHKSTKLTNLYLGCSSSLHTLFSLKQLSGQEMRDILLEAQQQMPLQYQQKQQLIMDQNYMPLYQMYLSSEMNNRDGILHILTESVQIFENSYYIVKQNSFKLDWNAYSDMFTQHILFYLTVSERIAFAQTSSQSNYLHIQHLNYKTYVQEQILKEFEKQHKPLLMRNLHNKIQDFSNK